MTYGIISNVRINTFGTVTKIFDLAGAMIRNGYLESQPVTACPDIVALEDMLGADCRPVAHVLADAIHAWRSERMGKHTGEGDAPEPRVSIDDGSEEGIKIEASRVIHALRGVADTVSLAISDGHRRLGALTLANCIIKECDLDHAAIEPTMVECTSDEWRNVQRAMTSANDHAERVARLDRARDVLHAYRDGEVSREADLAKPPFGYNKGKRIDAWAIAKLAHYTDSAVETFDGRARNKLQTLRSEADKRAKDAESPESIRDFILGTLAEWDDKDPDAKPLTVNVIRAGRDGGVCEIVRPLLDAILSGDEKAFNKLCRMTNAQAEAWAADAFASVGEAADVTPAE